MERKHSSPSRPHARRAEAPSVANADPAHRSRSGLWLRTVPRRAARAVRRVLVVDDDPLILRLVVRVLENEGCQVVTAQDAEQALQILRAGAHEFSLLLSDVGLPGLSGVELVRLAGAIEPAMPTLLMSGESKDSLIVRGVLGPGSELLAKPFSATTLLAKLEQILEPTWHTLQG